MNRPTVESLFGHMDRYDRERLSTVIREEAKMTLRSADILCRSGKYSEQEADEGWAYTKRRAAQYVEVADWIERG